MILGSRKTQEQDQEKNWCVVLNPLESEMDRKRMAAKISEVFSISLEESHDLVRSTPIILLDHLTKTMAEKIKEYFAPLHAELVISKDTLFKRKCYRTLWPQAPSLSFLHQMEPKIPAERPMTPDRIHEPLRPEDALNEIRKSLSSNPIEEIKPSTVIQTKQEIPKPTKPEETKKPTFTGFSYSGILEKQKTKEETPSIPLPTPKTSIPSTPAPTPVSAVYQQELASLRKNLENVEERYDALKGEYRDSRNVFEEKISRARLDNEVLRKKIDEVLQNHEQLQKDKTLWNSEFQEKSSTILRAAQQSQEAQNILKDEQMRLTQEIEKISFQLREFKSYLDQVDHGKQNLEAAFVRMSEKSKQTFDQWQDESLQMANEIESLGKQFIESQSRFDQFEASNQKLESAMVEQQTYLSAVKHHLADIEKAVADSLKREAEERVLREQIQRKQAELEKAHETFKREVGGSTRQIIQAEFQGIDFDKKFGAFNEFFQKQYDMLDAILKQLIVRESQRGLEETPKALALHDEKRVRATAQLDQHKYLSARLGDKESMLKRLVAEQEKIEKDMTEREEEMRRVIAEQEKIEKEIIEVRQAQRQWDLSDKSR